MSDWFKIRDMFCGLLHGESKKQNDRFDDFQTSLRLMQTCNHPDAKLLSSILSTVEHRIFDVVAALLQHNNLIANTYGVLVNFAFGHGDGHDVILCCDKSAKLNHALSQACLIFWKSRNQYSVLTREEEIILAEAKKSGDCYVYYVSGLVKHDKQDLYLAFDLGWHSAADEIFSMTHDVIEKIEISGRKALRGFTRLFLSFWNEQKYPLPGILELYHFGKYFSKLSIPIILCPQHEQQRCINVFKHQNVACRKAIDAFTLCAIRLTMYKDMRVYISKMVWATRTEALFI